MRDVGETLVDEDRDSGSVNCTWSEMRLVKSDTLIM